MAVAVRSMTPARVCSGRPLRSGSISRLRRVAASRMTRRRAARCCRPRMWGRLLRWVSWTYCSRQPAAPTASGSVGAAEAGQVAGAELARRAARWALSRSKCQAGRRVTPPSRLESCRAGWLSSANRISAGCRRSQLAAQGVLVGHFQHREAAAAQSPGRRGRSRPVARADRRQQVVAALIQQGLVGQRARRDDAHHLALHRALAGGRVADLLADGHRLAGAPAWPDSPRPRGRARRPWGWARRRTCPRLVSVMSSSCGRAFGVVEEQLVEVPHAVEQQHLAGAPP